jgi:prophage tail gpP-like protein
VNAAAFRAIWDRLKDTLLYKATVKGHRDPDSGALWTIDTIVNIQDEVTDVNEPMWIHKRTFRYTPGSGAETDIECWRIGALQLGASG